MNNDLTKAECCNSACFHLDHGIETKPEIGLLNTIIDKLDRFTSQLENLDRKVNYSILRIFTVHEELAQISNQIEKVNSDIQRIITLERVLTILLNR